LELAIGQNLQKTRGKCVPGAMHEFAGHNNIWKYSKLLITLLLPICVMQQNIYLTLLPTRPNLVNVALYECHLNYSYQMPDFSFKMHEIHFQLGLRPRPRWGAHSAPRPRPPSWIWGRGREEEEKEGKGGRKEGEERGEEGKGEGKGREG